MSLYGSQWDSHYDYSESLLSSGNATTPHKQAPSNPRSPLSTISLQQSIMQDPRKSFANPRAKSTPCLPGILPCVTGDDFPRAPDENDETRSCVSFSNFAFSQSFASATPYPALDRSSSDSRVDPWLASHAPFFQTRCASGASRPVSGSRSCESPRSHDDHDGSVRVKSEVRPTVWAQWPNVADLRHRKLYQGSCEEQSSIFGSAVLPEVFPATQSILGASFSRPSSCQQSVVTSTSGSIAENHDEDEPMDLDDSISMAASEANAMPDLRCATTSRNEVVDSSDSSFESSFTTPKNLSDDPFLRQKQGILFRIFFLFFWTLRILLSAILKAVRTTLLMILLTFAFSIGFYTLFYLGSHYASNAHNYKDTLIDLETIENQLEQRLFGQPFAKTQLVNELRSFLASDDKKRLLSLHGSTGVGKSYAVNILKKHLPPSSVHVLYPDLVVHELENAGAEQVARVRDWITTRIRRRQKLKLVVIENADAHLELLDIVMTAVGEVVRGDADEAADPSTSQDEGQHVLSGFLTKIDSVIEFVFGLETESPSQPHNDKVLFLCLSNVGFRHINSIVYRAMQNGQERSTTSEVKDDIETTLEENEQSFFASLHRTGLKAGVAIFLPLGRDQLRQCLLENAEFLDVAGSNVDEVTETVLDKADFFPRADPTFSVSGCKRISSLILN